MQEAAYATLTSQLHAYFETGKAPRRTGNASRPCGTGPLRDRAQNDYRTPGDLPRMGKAEAIERTIGDGMISERCARLVRRMLLR